MKHVISFILATIITLSVGYGINQVVINNHKSEQSNE